MCKETNGPIKVCCFSSMEISSALEALSLLSHSLHVMKDTTNVTNTTTSLDFHWLRQTPLWYNMFSSTLISIACNYIHCTSTGQYTVLALVRKKVILVGQGPVKVFYRVECLISWLLSLSVCWYRVFQSSAILTKLDQPLVHVRISSSCCLYKSCPRAERKQANGRQISTNLQKNAWQISIRYCSPNDIITRSKQQCDHWKVFHGVSRCGCVESCFNLRNHFVLAMIAPPPDGLATDQNSPKYKSGWGSSKLALAK